MEEVYQQYIPSRERKSFSNGDQTNPTIWRQIQGMKRVSSGILDHIQAPNDLFLFLLPHWGHAKQEKKKGNVTNIVEVLADDDDDNDQLEDIPTNRNQNHHRALHSLNNFLGLTGEATISTSKHQQAI